MDAKLAYALYAREYEWPWIAFHTRHEKVAVIKKLDDGRGYLSIGICMERRQYVKW
jgi:hypothetical protein